MAKARTRTSAPGSDRRPRGFTLVELLVVLTLVALASGMVALALRDGEADRLEREGIRLAALLESARAESRASAAPVLFELTSDLSPGRSPGGPDRGHFRFNGLPPGDDWPERWLDGGTEARIEGRSLRLGPEPMIGAQRIVLRRDRWEITIQTDGLGPFEASPPVEVPAR